MYKTCLILILSLIPLNRCFGDSRHLKIAMVSNLANVDPVKVYSVAEMYIVSTFCRPLIRVSDKGEVEGLLVKSWHISQDKKTYTFHLKEGIRFHDGSELSVDDVIFSFSRHFWEGIQSGWRTHLAFITGSEQPIKYGGSLSSLTKVDKYILKISLQKPYLPLLSLLSQTCLCISKKGAPLVGTGPMQLEGSTKENSWTVSRVSQSQVDRKLPRKITFYKSKNWHETVKQFENGDVDILIGSQLNRVKDFEAKYPLNTMNFIGIDHFLFNIKSTTFPSKEDREVFGTFLKMLAWKKENIDYGQEVSPALFPSSLFIDSSRMVKQDFEKVMRQVKLRFSNTKKPIQIKLVEALFSEQFIADLKSHLNRLDIKYDLVLLRGPDWFPVVKAGQFDVTHYPMKPSFFDPDGMFYSLNKYFSNEHQHLFKKLNNARHVSRRRLRIQEYAKVLREIEDQWVVVPAYRTRAKLRSAPGIQLPKTAYMNEFESWKIFKKK